MKTVMAAPRGTAGPLLYMDREGRRRREPRRKAALRRRRRLRSAQHRPGARNGCRGTFEELKGVLSMALSRKYLEGMGLDEKQVASIIEGHTESTEALKGAIEDLKGQLEALKAQAGEAEQLRKELEGYKSGGGEDVQGKYDDLKREFEAYKAEIAGKEQAAKVRAAYKRLLDDEHIDPNLHELILKGTDISGMKLDKDGGLEGAEALKKAISEGYAKFRVRTEDRGADVGSGGQGGGDGGANPLAAQLAQRFHERRYGPTGGTGGGSGERD